MCVGAVEVLTGMGGVGFFAVWVSLESGLEALYSGPVSGNSTAYLHRKSIFFSPPPYIH